jgi:hypothetical protein
MMKTPLWALAVLAAAGAIFAAATSSSPRLKDAKRTAKAVQPEELVRACERIIQQLDSEPAQAA